MGRTIKLQSPKVTLQYSSTFWSVDTLASHNYKYGEKAYKETTEMYDVEEVEIILLDNVQPDIRDLINEEDLLEESTPNL